MERISYCPTCNKLSWTAGEIAEKRRPLCHSRSSQIIYLCSCGFGLPAEFCGLHPNLMQRHNELCPPLAVGRFNEQALRGFIEQFRVNPHPRCISLTSEASDRERSDAVGHDGGPASKRPRMDPDEIIELSDDDEEVSVYSCLR